MRIGLDLDEVCADMVTPLMNWHNAMFGSSFTRKDVFSYDFAAVWKCSLEDSMVKFRDFYNSRYFDDVLPYPGAIDGIEFLSKGNELILITAREQLIDNQTNEWINKYFPNKFSQIFFAKHHIIGGRSKTKAEICKELGVDILVEDYLGYVIPAAKVTKIILLMDQPWNQTDSLPQNVHRVFSWKEITGLIENSKSKSKNI